MKILIIKPNAPGSGHQANGNYLAEGFISKGHDVTVIEEDKDETKVSGGSFEVVIISGEDKRNGGNSLYTKKVIGRCNINGYQAVMHFPPPNCGHICNPPWIATANSVQVIDLPEDIPYLKEDDCQEPDCAIEMEAMAKEKNALVAIAYINVTTTVLSSISQDLSKITGTEVLVFNFSGKHGNGVIARNKVSQSEFKALLMKFQELPFFADGANSIGAAQACPVPYYDLSFSRVLGNSYRPSLKNIVKLMGHINLKKKVDFEAMKLMFTSYYSETESERVTGRFQLLYDLFQTHIH